MKKIIKICVLFLVFVLVQQNVFCVEQTKTPVKFIYINGSNNNTEKDKITFTNGMKDMHYALKRDLEANSFIEENMLNKGNMYIKSYPKIFFWGYNSEDSLRTVTEDINSLDMISPKGAQNVRKIIAAVLHDAIWVQKEYNMQLIVNNLHKDVMHAYSKGEKVVLLGHSAGSFVTYRYLFHKLPVMTQDELLSAIISKVSPNLSFYKKYSIKPTCADAITASGIAAYSSTGNLIINQNQELLKKEYLKLNSYTSTECAPDGEVLGTINFGSPVALFYSDNGGSNLEINKYNKDMYRYIKDKSMFFLTVNFTDDPIGFPLTKNLSREELENLYNIGFNQTGKGFFYSKSDVRSPASFIGAHNSYWKYPNKFSKMVVKAYIDGYKNFYSD